MLGGGRGSVTGAIGGALVLQALFMLLNLYSVESAVEQTVTGHLIIAAVSVAAFRTREAEELGCELVTQHKPLGMHTRRRYS